MTTEDPIVNFRDVTYQLDHRPLVSDLNFDVHRAEIVVLLGRSGSGKTTTLKLINRLIVPSGGTISVEGIPTVEWDPIRLRRRIGYVIQEIGLFPHFTVERNVAVVPTLERWKPVRIRERVDELLRMVGLSPERFARRYPHELSGGQRQRVGVARALAADPPLLLMDEPFGALDPITRLELQREFRQLQRSLGKSVIFVTHDIQEAFLLGSRIGLMVDGRLVELTTPDRFLQSEKPEALPFIECLNSVRNPQSTIRNPQSPEGP
ncbi:MAG TPA: ATP-binding cassette domain-containing protein [Acidobacteriota bacterium]|nr:ATP-binding cassette domain-containing protein [Acidobacteriota bacterium]